MELAEEFDQKQIQSVLLEHVSHNRAEQLALLPDIRKRLLRLYCCLIGNSQ